MEENIVKILQKGGVGVLPTDTMYGLVASALDKESVQRVYTLKKRSPDKPFIILISSFYDLELFHINLSEKVKIFLEKIWPNPVSVILLCKNKELFYLHRGTKTLAFRMPKNQFLLNILSQTGPLIAPSANTENQPPAQTIKEAKKYFEDRVDFYLDKGKLDSPPSTLIKIDLPQKITVLREGVFPLDEDLISQGRT